MLNALLEQSKNGQQPFGPFAMPEILAHAVFRLFVARIFYILMGFHGLPLRARSLEEAVTALNIPDLGGPSINLTVISNRLGD